MNVVNVVNAVNSKTFKSGNSVAVRLPKGIGFAPGLDVVVERNGDVVTIRPVADPAEEKRKVRELIETLRALPKPPYVEKLFNMRRLW